MSIYVIWYNYLFNFKIYFKIIIQQLLSTHLFRFRLFLYDERHREVISNSRRLKKLPNINRLSIEDIQYNRDINVKDFLLNVAPHTLEQFIFGGDWKYRLKVTFYLEGLHAVLKSTTREVRFGFCKFSSSDLQSIFIAAKHINTLWFNWCELYFTDEFDIKEESFHIEELSLEVWSYYSRLENIIDGLEILVKAVVNSSLKHSLNTIQIRDDWKIYIEYKDYVKEIFERHDLQDVLELKEVEI